MIIMQLNTIKRRHESQREPLNNKATKVTEERKETGLRGTLQTN